MKKISLNDEWMFSKDESSLTGDMLSGSGDADKPKIVTLPHDAMISEFRNADNPSGNAGGFYPGGNYVYKKTFIADESYDNKTVMLEFEGVYHYSIVYVNGDFAGRCMDGYRNYYVNISPFLKYGMENTILVKAINGNTPNSRWYTGSGIYRQVNLFLGDKIYIEPNGLKIRTPEVSEQVSSVETEITFKNELKKVKKVYFVTEISDVNENVISVEKTLVTIYPGSTPKIIQALYIKDAVLWSVDNPNLYTCSVMIMDAEDCLNFEECEKKNVVFDKTESKFGIRHIQIDPVNGMRLNGEKILLRGACIHHDNGVVGAATFTRAEERRVELLKEAGFNSIRMAHNPASKALLDACDKIGMLVIDESFDVWNNSKEIYDDALHFSEQWEANIEALVAKDYNHPCVFMYSIGNEIQEIGNPAGAALNREIANKIRELDHTRYVTNAINGLLTIMDELDKVMVDLGMLTEEQAQQMVQTAEKSVDSEQDSGGVNDVMTMLMGQMNYLTTHHFVEEKLEESIGGLDVTGYNYMSGRYVADAEKNQNRVMYGSETLPPDIDVNWQYVKNNPQILGDYTWTGFDYLGEAGVGVVDYNTTSGFFKPFPVYMAYCGDLDIIGNRRPISYYREIVWGLRKVPYIAVQLPQHYDDIPFCTPWSNVDSLSSWTWPGYEGKKVRVEVYAESDETELFLNKKSLGKMPTGEANRFKAIFEITYEPGILEAVSYSNNQETGRFALNTADDAKEISVNCDKTSLCLGKEDLSYLMISIRDESGNLNTAADTILTVDVEGAGILQGFGSADPISTENFFDKSRTTFNGKVLAVVKAGNERGVIKVTVSSKEFNSKIVEIKVI